jgi:hypothetical protein
MQFYRKKFLLFLVILIVFGIQNLEASIIQSSFEDDEEGWTLRGGSLSWNDSGGNPGGFIIAEDVIDTNMDILAPPKFLGNLLEFENGTISFDAIELENVSDPWHTFGVVTITSDAGSISKDLAPGPLRWVWTHYSGILSAAEWGVSDSEWKAILSNVTEITINIESGWFVGAETVGVDNIIVDSDPMTRIIRPLNTVLESTFDKGDEGWWIYFDGKNFTYHASGGNPGGFISVEDQGLGETWFFVSPDTWAGDWSSFLGGTISFDQKLISGDTNKYYSAVDVIIDTEGTGHYASWSSGIDPKLGTWTHYEVRISESNFEITGDRTWGQILSNVTNLVIRGEHIVGPDTEGIDNIRVVESLKFFSISPILQLLLDNE